jgi:hypothetical protein
MIEEHWKAPVPPRNKSYRVEKLQAFSRVLYGRACPLNLEQTTHTSCGHSGVTTKNVSCA